MAAEADLVILAAPVRQNIARLRELPQAVAGPAVVTDVGSVKARVVAAVDHPRFVGGHPMAGSEAIGVDAPADAPDEAPEAAEAGAPPLTVENRLSS